MITRKSTGPNCLRALMLLCAAIVGTLAITIATVAQSPNATGGGTARTKRQPSGAASLEIPFKAGTVRSTARTTGQAIEQIDALTSAGARHIIVQFDKPLSVDERQKVEASGLQLLNYLSNNAFFASVPTGQLNRAALGQVASLRDARAIQRVWKLDAFLRNNNLPPHAVFRPEAGKEPVDGEAVPQALAALYVMFHADVSLDPTGSQVVLRHGALIRSKIQSNNGMVIELPVDNIPALADEDAVMWLETALPALTENNSSNRARVGANTVQAPPYSLSGSGVSVLVYDGGKVRATHQDLTPRVTIGATDTSSTSDHSTHVAGTVGGTGAASAGNNRGMAPAVAIISYGFEQPGGLQPGFLYTDPGDLEADYTAAINTYGADISNNSIGTNTAPNGYPCSWEGDYGFTDTIIDDIVRGGVSGGVPFRIVWANGNERQGSARCGSTYNTTAPPACAKNHITVGALNSNDDSMTSFSSWGPADDGRMKPDISAPGCEVGSDNGVTSCSSSSDTAYSVKCGTSMASPTVCGMSALLLEDYRAQFPGNPDFRNSTLKILLAHTAVDLGNPGPDMQFGYGSVRIQPAVDFMRTGNFLENEVSQGGTFSVLVVVNPGDPQLKVTLAWDDPPGTPNVSPALVNDLDLVVFDPNNDRKYPWTHVTGNPGAPAVQTAEDHINNIEQVVVNAPAPGAYRVEVRGTNVPTGPQPFSLCASPLLVNCSTVGVASMDREKYPCSSTATLRVSDCDLNTDDMVVESVTVTVASTTEAAGESVLLTETGPETALFLGSIDLSTTDSAGVLHVAHGDVVTMTYIDADDGFGGMNIPRTDTADVDCVAPVISNVQATNILPRSATITCTTDEDANVTVRYGTSCGSLTGTATVSGYRTSHSIPITGLQDNTTYYYVVDAVDRAGNSSSDDNGGSCYTFMTPEVPDFFTQLFTSNNDLDNISIMFTPNASVDFYAACTAQPIATLPTDPTGGTTLTLTDDSSTSVALAGNDTVKLYGTAYSSFFVGSNGYITFGVGDSDLSETIADHFDTPRISALFDDLNPTQGSGSISWKQLTDRAVVTWLNVPQHNVTGDTNTFQIEMFYDGRIQISWLSIGATDGLAGLSQGLGVDPDFLESDLSTYPSCGPRPPSAGGGSLNVPTGITLPITLPAGDDGLPDPPAALSYIIVSVPDMELLDAANDHLITAGELPYTLVGGGNQVKYLATGGYTGPDSFTYKANDGGTPPDGGDSNIATITLSVDPVLTLPFADDFPSTTIDSNKWKTNLNTTVDTAAINPPTPPYAARFNGSPAGGDQLISHLIDLSSQDLVELSYAYEIKGNGDSPEAGDDLFVEYQDSNGTWQLLQQHLGSGPDMTNFQNVAIVLPAQALHAAFKLRFRSIGTASATPFDDWFVDNISVVALNAPTAESGAFALAVNEAELVMLNSSDPNMDPLDTIILSLPTHGRLRDPNGGFILSVPYTLLAGGKQVHYIPQIGYAGADSFTFKVTDGQYESNVASMSATIGGITPVHTFPLDTDPGWARMGQWQFGQPTGGGSGNHDPTGGFTGPNVFGYNLNGDYPNNLNPTQYLTTTAIDCSGATSMQLRFRRWLGIEASAFDRADIQVSNNGSTWTTVWQHSGNAITETAWSLQVIDISAVADGQPTVYVRWGMGVTDNSVTYPGWNLDDVEIWGFVPTACPPVTPGDVSLDSNLDGLDVVEFARVMMDPVNASVAERCAADVNEDSYLDDLDAPALVNKLLFPSP